MAAHYEHDIPSRIHQPTHPHARVPRVPPLSYSAEGDITVDEINRLSMQLDKLGERFEEGNRAISSKVDALSSRLADLAQTTGRIEERQTASREALDTFKTSQQAVHAVHDRRLTDLEKQVDANAKAAEKADSEQREKTARLYGGVAVVAVVASAVVSMSIALFKQPAPSQQQPQVIYVPSSNSQH